MPELRARGLWKRFDGIAVVKGVDITIRPGEIVGCLGPNGSGKTTTARMLAGLLPPSEGHIEYGGTNVYDDLVTFHRDLGYIPEEPHLYPFLSGREFLLLVGRLRGMSERLSATKIDAFLELFGITGAADQSIAGYSKGMRQKVLITAALMQNPSLILFDEPESGLDVGTTLVLRHLVKQLAARGKAVLYSSHILEVVERVCSRVIVLYQGAVVADDTVERLQAVMSRTSLEGVFSELVMLQDPARIAGDLADVSIMGA